MILYYILDAFLSAGIGFGACYWFIKANHTIIQQVQYTRNKSEIDWLDGLPKKSEVQIRNEAALRVVQLLQRS